MLVILASMLEQIGLPGSGYHYTSGGTTSASALVLGPSIDPGKSVKDAEQLTDSGSASIPVARVVDLLMKPGEEFDFNSTKAKYLDVKMIDRVGGNPFVHHQQRNRMLEASTRWRLCRARLPVPTARHADIVLPATPADERNAMELSATIPRATPWQ